MTVTSYFDLCSIIHVNCNFSCCLQTKVLHCNQEGSGASHYAIFLKMLGIVAVAGRDVLKYLTIAVANVAAMLLELDTTNVK